MLESLWHFISSLNLLGCHVLLICFNYCLYSRKRCTSSHYRRGMFSYKISTECQNSDAVVIGFDPTFAFRRIIAHNRRVIQDPKVNFLWANEHLLCC